MSTVIKATGPIRTMDGVSFNFDDMADRANQYLDQVRAQAAQIMDAAQREAEKISHRAEEQGRQAALRAAEKVLDEKVNKQMQTLLPALKEAVTSIEQAKQTWLVHWEKTAVRLACRIAARILRREQQKDPQIALAMVKDALELASGSPEIHVHLNPDDHAALGGQVEALVGELSRLAQSKIVSDPAITAGGCRVVTRFGSIDKQFEAQLARIEQELT